MRRFMAGIVPLIVFVFVLPLSGQKGQGPAAAGEVRKAVEERVEKADKAEKAGEVLKKEKAGPETGLQKKDLAGKEEKGGKKEAAHKDDAKEPAGADKEKMLLQEENLHTKRLAQIERLAILAQEEGDEEFRKAIEKLRGLEEKRHKRRVEALNRAPGKQEEQKAKKSIDAGKEE